MAKSFRMSFMAAAAVLATCLPALALEGVVASIKPVHSLVAAVMEGAGEPALIVRGGGSEHAHSLRPSDAQALERATIVFRIGDRMETFLNAPLETLAINARVISLEDTPGLKKLGFREGGPFETHAHGGEHAHDHDHDHGHDNHSHANHGDHDDHGDYDLHIWLDPDNARAMLAWIASILGEADPHNAQLYLDNAQAYSSRLDELVTQIETIIAPVRDKPVIVFHDAYQYFEQRFGVNVVGSITVNPEVAPGAQRLKEIRDKLRELNAACVFSEPQFLPRPVATVMEGTNASSGVLDPLGAEIADGPELYPALMRNLALSLASCLEGAD